MQYRRLGSTNLSVSELCLGTMMFGDRTDEKTSHQIISMALDAGVNFIDTADMYAKGESEKITGSGIKANRSKWILASKVGNRIGDDAATGGLSKGWITRACEDSLKRLNTNYIDIYYCHFDDQTVPLEESILAMGDLLKAGKIRHWALSNYRGWRIGLAVAKARELGVSPPEVCQPYYNAMNRMPEVEVLPACAHYGLGIVPYSPVARGVLAGKYEPGKAPPPDSRAGRKDMRMMETEFRPESIAMAQIIKQHAEATGRSAVQFAVGWVLNNTLISSVIVGPRTVEHWTEYVGALQHKFSSADEELIDSLVKPGHPSTPGYSDPRYPFFGRIVRSEKT